MMPNLQENAYFRQIYTRVTESGSIRGYRNPLPLSLSLKMALTFSKFILVMFQLLFRTHFGLTWTGADIQQGQQIELPYLLPNEKSITPLYITQNGFNATQIHSGDV